MKKFDDVKACYTLPDAWHNLNLYCEARKSCRCTWQEDRKPSISVYDEGGKFEPKLPPTGELCFRRSELDTLLD
jgi:hypothetical protein